MKVLPSLNVIRESKGQEKERPKRPAEESLGCLFSVLFQCSGSGETLIEDRAFECENNGQPPFLHLTREVFWSVEDHEMRVHSVISARFSRFYGL